jgi:hypothetical protein
VQRYKKIVEQLRYDRFFECCIGGVKSVEKQASVLLGSVEPFGGLKKLMRNLVG